MLKKRALRRLFTALFNEQIDTLNMLPQSGSYREYYRIRGVSGKTAIGTYNEDKKENAAFLSFCRHFRAHGLRVPEVLAEDNENNIYLLEDLENLTLFAYLTKVYNKGFFPGELINMYKTILEDLPRFQIIAGKTLDYSKCYPRFSFDRQSIMWDLNYFKYYFLKLARISFDEQELENDFNRFADYLLETECDYFLYRDFQSRNIMIRDGKPWYIDFQGGRKGALQYDVASLLYDAKADIPQTIRDELLEYYLDSLQNYKNVNRVEFKQYYTAYVYARIMQAMGAYGFRGFYEKKQHFLKSVPYAVDNIRYLLAHTRLPIEVPVLMDVMKQITEAKHLQQFGRMKSDKLTVTVYSFSYKRGIPDDTSGNGGGFIFDCRGILNPGRFDEYKQMTGRHESVKQFLETRTIIDQFVSHAIQMVDINVQDYVRRDFSHLLVGFGCTGGRHRSVYCADRLAEHLSKRGDINVKLIHREQDF